MAGDSHRVACIVCGDDTYALKRMTPTSRGYVCPGDANGFGEDELGESFRIQKTIQARPADESRTTSVIPLYQKAEASIFNLIAADGGGGVAPYAYVNVTAGDGQIIGAKSVRAAAWSILYLYGVLQEDRRPKVWIDRATVKLRELADYLLTQQCGSPTEATAISTVLGPTVAANTEYGGFVVMEGGATLLGTVYSEDVSSGGMALLRAYQALGDEKYRAGYRRALTCLRRMQSGGKLTTAYAVGSLAGTDRLHTGMWAHKLEIRDGAGGGGGGGGPVVPDPGTDGFVLTEQRTGSDGVYWSTVPIDLNESRWNIWVLDFSRLPGTQLRITIAGLFLNTGTVDRTATWRVRAGAAYDNASDTPVYSNATEVLSFTKSGLGTTDYLSYSGVIAKPSLTTGQIIVTVQSSDVDVGGSNWIGSPVLLVETY